MANVATVEAKLTADTEQFSTAIKGVLQLIDSFTNKLGGVEGVLEKGFTVAAIVSVTNAVVEATKQAGEYAESLEHISAITGLNTASLQGWEVALRRVGLSTEDLTMSMRRLSQNIVEAQSGIPAAIQKFRAMHIEINDMSTTDAVFRQIADASERMGNTNNRTAAMTELVGRAALRMIPAFKDGSKAIDEAADASKRMTELTSAQIEFLNKSDDAFDDLHTATSRLSNQIGAAFAPAVYQATKALTDLVIASAQWVQGPGGQLAKQIMDLVLSITRLTEAIVHGLMGALSGISTMALGVVNVLASLGNAFINMNSEVDINAKVSLTWSDYWSKAVDALTARFTLLTTAVRVFSVLVSQGVLASTFTESGRANIINAAQSSMPPTEYTPVKSGDLLRGNFSPASSVNAQSQALLDKIQEGLGRAGIQNAQADLSVLANVRELMSIRAFGEQQTGFSDLGMSAKQLNALPGFKSEIGGNMVQELAGYNAVAQTLITLREQETAKMLEQEKGMKILSDSNEAFTKEENEKANQVSRGMGILADLNEKYVGTMNDSANALDKVQQHLQDVTNDWYEQQAALIITNRLIDDQALTYQLASEHTKIYNDAIDQQDRLTKDASEMTLILGHNYSNTTEKVTQLSGKMLDLSREMEDLTGDDLVKAQKEFENLKATLTKLEDQKGIEDAINGVFNSLNAAIDGTIQGIMFGTQTMSQGIKNLVANIGASLSGSAIKAMLKPLQESITSAIAESVSVEGIKSALTSMLPAGMSLGMAGGLAAGAAGTGFALSQVNWNNQAVNAGMGAMAGGIAGGIAGTLLLPGVGSLLGVLAGNAIGGFIGSMFGGDDGRAGRMRNQTDALNGHVAQLNRQVAQLASITSPAQLFSVISGSQGGAFADQNFANFAYYLGGQYAGANPHGGTPAPGTAMGFTEAGSALLQNPQAFRAQFLDAQGLEMVIGDQANQFNKSLTDAVQAIAKALNDANQKIVSQLIGMAQQTATQAATAQDFLLRRTEINQAIQKQIDQAHADMITMTDPTQLSQQVAKIQSLLQQRYQGEIQMVQSFVSNIQKSLDAWKGLNATITDQLAQLTLNRFGAPTPGAQFSFDQDRFQTAMTSFRNSRTVAAGQSVSDLASPLLQSALALYGNDATSGGYQGVWQTVVNALKEVQQTAVDQTAQLNQQMLAAMGDQIDLQTLTANNTKRMADSLDNLRLEAAAQFRAMGFNIPVFAEGTDSVPKTGLALVHKGEEIVPVGGVSKRGAGVTIQVSGNTFVGTEQSMLRDLARKISPYINSNPSL